MASKNNLTEYSIPMSIQFPPNRSSLTSPPHSVSNPPLPLPLSQVISASSMTRRSWWRLRWGCQRGYLGG
ncbi:hypothetical protein QJS04_geneDACA023124 [Acorus gramineus]|uniref:Uncharacterized protein n=1 Tax=Acorus gramineus TaxID=55184 RepID=A0AAV9BDZ6_ACOGR|nr:hypothetical protein QJS04_geneDACA023124 [Acorus gramineus]